MSLRSKRESIILLLGDLITLFLSLILTLILRYGAIPSKQLLLSHLIPFSFVFAVSILLYFVSGLYEKHTLRLKQRIPATLLNVQIFNAIIAIAFFYFIPYLQITPKTTLFIYLIISLILTTFWRMVGVGFFTPKKKQLALLISKGSEKKGEVLELYEEINNNPRYGIFFLDWIKDGALKEMSPEMLAGLVTVKGITYIAADFGDKALHPLMPALYKLIFSGVEFVDTRKLYEEIFNRIPLSRIDDTWCLENISSNSKASFDIFKRLMDIIISGGLLLISLIVYPFVWLAMRVDDRGVLFSYQQRIGQHNRIVNIVKFRTMTNANDGGQWTGESAQRNVVTRVGKFLRKSRIDELPQLWNVLRGDVSLIGPRPEFPEPVAKYSQEIPYYNLRHIVKPGLSGWAQIYGEHPHHGVDTEKTTNKLSYDLYYIKNRSVFLDLKIALQTMKVLITFAGR